jgi:hypothetical protein
MPLDTNSIDARLSARVGEALGNLERADRKLGTDPIRLDEAYMALMGAQTNIAAALYELGRLQQREIR